MTISIANRRRAAGGLLLCALCFTVTSSALAQPTERDIVEESLKDAIQNGYVAGNPKLALTSLDSSPGTAPTIGTLKIEFTRSGTNIDLAGSVDPTKVSRVPRPSTWPQRSRSILQGRGVYVAVIQLGHMSQIAYLARVGNPSVQVLEQASPQSRDIDARLIKNDSDHKELAVPVFDDGVLAVFRTTASRNIELAAYLVYDDNAAPQVRFFQGELLGSPP